MPSRGAELADVRAHWEENLHFEDREAPARERVADPELSIL